MITILRYGINKLYGADTAHILLRKNVVDLINRCILTRLDRGEDTYIAWRITESGFHYLIVPEMQAVHYGSFGISKQIKQATGYNGLLCRIPLSCLMLNSVSRFLRIS